MCVLVPGSALRGQEPHSDAAGHHFKDTREQGLMLQGPAVLPQEDSGGRG